METKVFRFRIECVREKLYLTAYRKVNGRFLEKSPGRISNEQLAKELGKPWLL